MKNPEAIKLLDDSIHHRPIADLQTFQKALILGKWALIRLEEEHQFYHEIFDQDLLT